MSQSQTHTPDFPPSPSLTNPSPHYLLPFSEKGKPPPHWYLPALAHQIAAGLSTSTQTEGCQGNPARGWESNGLEQSRPHFSFATSVQVKSLHALWLGIWSPSATMEPGQLTVQIYCIVLDPSNSLSPIPHSFTEQATYEAELCEHSFLLLNMSEGLD